LVEQTSPKSNASTQSTTRSGSIDTSWSPGFLLPAAPGTLEVMPKGSGSVTSWRVQFLGPAAVRRMLLPLLKTGLESLKPRFGVAK
jgi:hypothetical protein